MSAGTRTAEELVRYELEAMAAQSASPLDANPLSLIRTIAEGNATLAERWEEEMLVRIAEAIERATYRSFDFPVLPAAKAQGEATFSRASTVASQTLAIGAVLRVPNSLKQYRTLDAVTLGIGVSSGTARILADSAGVFANVTAGTVTELLTQPTGVAWMATNEEPVAGGRDSESDEERHIRFEVFIQHIHRATPDALVGGAMTVALYDGGGNVLEAVKDAQVADTWGLAEVTIWNGSASAPAASDDLLNRTREVLLGYTDGEGNLVPGYKAAGVGLAVAAATILPVDVTVAIYPQDGYQVNMIAPSVEASLLAVFGRQRLGADKLRLNDLRQAIGLTRGVIDHVLNTPTADVPGGDGIIVVPGVITILAAT